MTIYEVLIQKTGDRAEADSSSAALRTAAQLVDDHADATGLQGARRAAQDSILILQDGVVSGITTALAREGYREVTP